MKDRTIRVLLIAIALVGLFIVVQHTWRGQKENRDHRKITVFELYPGTLTSLQFKRADSVIDCINENGVWMVGNPEQGMGQADVVRIAEMVRDLTSLGKGTTITKKELELRGLSSAEYGFDPPVLEITAVDNRGRHVWQVGRNTPTELEVYVREAEGSEIYTILRRLWEIVPEDPDDLRNRALFTGDVMGIKRLEIRGSTAGFVRIVKEASSGWRLQQPIVSQADPGEVTAYIEHLRNIRIEDFIAENASDLSAYGLQGESKQIALTYSDGSSSTLILGDAIPGRSGLLYARRADDTSVFAVKSEILQFFELPDNPFRDARILTLARDEIGTIQIKRGDLELTLSRNPAGTWQVTSPVVWDAKSDAVYNLVELWNKAVVTEYDVSAGSTASDWTLDFVSAESGTTNRIDVLAAGDRKDGLLIRMNNEPAIYQINLPLVPNSIIDPLTYKSSVVWNLSRADIIKLILGRVNREDQVVERSAEGAFVALLANGNTQVDMLAVERTITRLCNLITTGYISYNPRSLDIYGLSNPSIQLYVGLADTNELGRVLLIGRETSEGFYSMVKGRDVVFYLDKATVESLSADLIVKPDISIQVAE